MRYQAVYVIDVPRADFGHKLFREAYEPIGFQLAVVEEFSRSGSNMLKTSTTFTPQHSTLSLLAEHELE